MVMDADRIRQLIATIRAEHAKFEEAQHFLAHRSGGYGPKEQAWLDGFMRELEVADALEALLAENEMMEKAQGGWIGRGDRLEEYLEALQAVVLDRDARIERLEAQLEDVTGALKQHGHF